MEGNILEVEDNGGESSGAGLARQATGRQGLSAPVARPRRVDEFAASNTLPDYKDFERLRRYINPQGKILPRRRTSLSAKHQRLLARAIKRARHLALLPIPGTKV